MSSKNVPERGIVYFHPRDGMDADFTYASFFLGRPLLGMRVADALEVSAYLRSRPDVDTRRIAVVGRGWAGVVALFAAALDPGIQAAAVEGIPASYGEIARSEIYQQPVSLMLPGVLRDFDLPDVAGAVAPRALLVLNPTDALTKKMTREAALEALKPASSAFQGQVNSRALEIEVFPVEEETVNRLLEWLARS
jgi:dienelactone hydrolase